VEVVCAVQKNPFTSYETQGSILHLQGLATSPDPEPDESIPQAALLLLCSFMLIVIVYL